MRRDYQIAILLALAALPAGVALVAPPEYIKDILKKYPGSFFWGGLLSTSVLIAAAVIIALSGEASEPSAGHKRRIIALAGMVVCGLGFLSFTAAFFWPSSDSKQNEAASPSQIKNPDVTLRFVYPAYPALVLMNQSDVIARNIKLSIAVWNIDDPRTYVNADPPADAHDPLPIPAAMFDFLRPRTSSGPQNLFNSSLASPHIKNGQRLFGSVSVICPECARGHTFVISIVWGHAGWYTEVMDYTEGQLVTPKNFKKETVQAYYNELTSRIPESARIAIGGLTATNSSAAPAPSPVPPTWRED